MTALTRLRLLNYRSYGELDLALEGRPVCLFGPNGAGKTNLLEAVSQLGPGRGLRSAGLQELVRTGTQDGWTVTATLGERHIGVALDTAAGGAKRIVRIDGASASAASLSELARIIWLTPAMDSVFRSGASERRRFYDRQVMAHIPAHGTASARYEKAMRERNALLERGTVDPGWADAIEARMADAGAQIAANRAIILERLQAEIEARPDGAFPKADLALDGAFETAALHGATLDTIEADMAEALRTGRRRDMAAGRTLTGPHRSDLLVVHRPTGAPAREASTGQQKALLIGLILASATALARQTDGPPPLILLDEAAAHLDADRRAALFDELVDLPGQAWLTGTEAYLFDAFGHRAQRIEVRDGQARLAGD